MVKSLLLLTACVGIGAGTGWGLSEMKTSQWRSTIKFDAPTVIELGNYYSLATTYALLQGEKMAEVEQTISQKSYAEFKRNLSSPDLLKLYLTESEVVKQQASAQNLPIDTVAQQIAPHFQLDEKNNQFSVTLENPEKAKLLLTNFILFITEKTRQILKNELTQKWKILFQQVKYAAENNLGPIQTGEQVAKQDWSGKLNLMRSVSPLDENLVAFRLLQVPTTPTTPISPDKSLWVMIGALAGLVFGLFGIVLLNFRNASK
ncbi:hypothetical protein A6B43_05145 [Vespertiliibacter pulmonis]|nr:hypothetical protein A6B43_05145 [Vespertiliibacter pulmonis]